MTIYTKPDFTRVWAVSAAGADITDPDTVTPGKFASGWAYEVPPYQYFNFIQNFQTEGLAYINQNGIGVWDTDTDYAVDSQAKGSDGKIYVALTASPTADPVGDATGDWTMWYESYLENTDRINLLINPGFRLSQRGLIPYSGEAAAKWAMDRWQINPIGAQTCAVARIDSTVGDDLIDESLERYSIEIETEVASDYMILSQPVEDIKSVLPEEGVMCLSFYAKSDVAIEVEPRIEYNWGSGGSTSDIENLAAAELTSTWQKFVYPFDVHHDRSTKTIGASSYLDIGFKSEPGVQATMEFTQMKLEHGSMPSRYNVPTLGEIYIDCQRYYYTQQLDLVVPPLYNSTSNLQRKFTYMWPTPMRITPTVSNTYSGFSGTPTASVNSEGVTISGTGAGATNQTLATLITADAEVY